MSRSRQFKAEKIEEPTQDDFSTMDVNYAQRKRRYWTFKNYDFEHKEYDWKHYRNFYVVARLDQDLETGKLFHHGIIATSKLEGFTLEDVKGLFGEHDKINNIQKAKQLGSYIDHQNIVRNMIYEFGERSILEEAMPQGRKIVFNKPAVNPALENKVRKTAVVQHKNNTSIVPKDKNNTNIVSKDKINTNIIPKEDVSAKPRIVLSKPKETENLKIFGKEKAPVYQQALDFDRKTEVDKIIAFIVTENWSYEHFYVYEPELFEKHKELIIHLLNDKQRLFVEYGLKKPKN